MADLTRLAAVLVLAAAGAPAVRAQAPLPEGPRGIAAKYPSDFGIEKDPAVLFRDDFEAGKPQGRWDNVFQEADVRITEEPANVVSGKRALEFTVPRQEAELSNAVVKHLKTGVDVLFLRFYSKFEKGFDQTGSSHNGAHMSAIAEGVPFATPGIRADGKNKFAASYECWRGDAKTPMPGNLNVYCYHPEQRSEYGDHFFPSGRVMPYSPKPADFGEAFVRRPEVVPECDRWYCYEFMVKANAAGRRDGRIACWLDGRLIADFLNLRLRDVETLKINYASLDLHIKSNTVRPNKKWYDAVVVATSYIGPIRK